VGIKRPFSCDSEEHVTKFLIYFREAHGKFGRFAKSALKKINSVKGSIIADGQGCEGTTRRSGKGM